MTDFIEMDLPLKKVAIFSSGVGFFERRGEVTGSAAMQLPFMAEDVSDALKSLTIMDPMSTMPSVTYPAQDTLSATLGSLKPDLTSNPGMAALLNAVRGARLEVTCASGMIVGRILGVEERSGVRDAIQRTARSDGHVGSYSAYLSLYDSGAVQLIDVGTILDYRFLDQGIEADVERALDVLLGAATSKLRNLEVRLPADGTREVCLSYVTSAPVWKAAYRLDLTEEPAFLQGWAIVDNASDVDWKDVELSLFVGRPSSFTQPLYQPYYVQRQEIPLAIAGSAEVREYEGAYDVDSIQAMGIPREMARGLGGPRRGQPEPVIAEGKPAGEQFAYTFPQLVSLERHQSAMLPLTQGDFTTRKLSIFSGGEVFPQVHSNPALGVEVVNTTGVTLPAGPVTVFDDGLYAGDALMDFLPVGAKRLLSYGDDLAVRGSYYSNDSNRIASAKLAHGVLTVNVKYSMRTQYEFVNESAKTRCLVVEHPRDPEEDLVQPRAAETTSDLYRFDIELPPNNTTLFVVEVTSMFIREISIVDDPRRALLTYSAWDIPEQARAVLEHAVELQQRKYDAETELSSLTQTESKLIADQARVRENLTVVGANSRSGAGYLSRLEELENRLVLISDRQEQVRARVEAVASELADFIASSAFD